MPMLYRVAVPAADGKIPPGPFRSLPRSRYGSPRSIPWSRHALAFSSCCSSWLPPPADPPLGVAGADQPEGRAPEFTPPAYHRRE
jgi:hypothetical protein